MPALVRATVLGGLVAALAGCGGSSPSHVSRNKGGSVRSSSTGTSHTGGSKSTGSSSSSGSDLRVVGAITETGGGTDLLENVVLGPIRYGEAGAPPEQVLSSLSNQNDALPSIIATSAYVQGELVLIYREGSLPITVSFDPTEVLGNITGGFPPDAGAIMYVDGQWQDGSGEGATVSFTMEPKQDVSVPVWILLPDVLSNATPVIPQAQADDITFKLVADITTGGSPSTESVSGPQAADCGGDHELLPFAKLPFAHKGNPYASVEDNSVTCAAGTGEIG
jgi:hypothetical protein